MNDTEAELVHAALRKYGYQSQSYNIATGDKLVFTSRNISDGVVVYVVIAGVAIAAGDPLCAEGDIRDLCADFRDFCQENGWRCSFQAVTQRTLEQLQYIGFGFLKIGEEPFIKLPGFSLAGGKFRDLRRDIRRAQSDGMTIVEYSPQTDSNPALEAEMVELAEDWQRQKGSGEFGFLVGTPSIKNPGARKFFVAMLNGHVEAFCVCTPVYARNAIYFDLLRRKERPVRGTVEYLIIDSFMQLKEQGYELATLGTAPLSGEHSEDPMHGWFIELAMDIAFDRLGYFYSFKPIYQFKEQFGADFWEPRYLAYHPARFNPVIIYALLKAYDPAAVRNLSQKQLAAAWDGAVWLAKSPVDLAEWLAELPLETANSISRLVSRVPRPGMPPLPGIPNLPGLPGTDVLEKAPQLLGRIRRMARLGGDEEPTDKG